jgi:hypothetical protein
LLGRGVDDDDDDDDDDVVDSMPMMCPLPIGKKGSSEKPHCCRQE